MDEIVAITPFRDYILVFTKNGRIYRVDHDYQTNIVVQRLLYEFDLTQIH